MLDGTHSITESGASKQSHACQVMSFGTLLREQLGERVWQKLDAGIRERFSKYVGADLSLRFRGKMQWVYCSPIGLLIAKIIRPFSILPDISVRDSDFTFTISLKDGELFKQREYALNDNRVFRFTSHFRAHPYLHEEFRGGTGMKLKLAVKRGVLLFRDGGYFWRFLKLRFILPAWLTVGRFELLHRNINTEKFQIIIRVAHPLFGTLFYQRGEFRAL